MVPGSLTHLGFLGQMGGARCEDLVVAHGPSRQLPSSNPGPSSLDRAQGPRHRPHGEESERLWCVSTLQIPFETLLAPMPPTPYVPCPEEWE